MWTWIAIMIGIVLVWLVCTVVSYRLLRRQFRKWFDTYTCLDREVCLIVAMTGLIGLIVSLSLMTIVWGCGDDTPAMW